jgi:hypothetical protein
VTNSAVSVVRFRHSQAPEGHLCVPSVELRFWGGAQRLGMRSAPSNSRGKAFVGLIVEDLAYGH